MISHMPRRPLFYLGADHAGFALKEALKPLLQRYGVEIEDLSPTFMPKDDYPLIGGTVARHVVNNDQTQGILVCGSGIGIAIAANRVRGVRAAVVHDADDAIRARSEDHANILVLGGRVLSAKKLPAILEAWLKTKPSKATRHVRRAFELDLL